MLAFLLLLEALTEVPAETTVLARPSGAPYVFYKEQQTKSETDENDDSEFVAVNEDEKPISEESN